MNCTQKRPPASFLHPHKTPTLTKNKTYASIKISKVKTKSMTAETHPPTQNEQTMVLPVPVEITPAFINPAAAQLYNGIAPEASHKTTGISAEQLLGAQLWQVEGTGKSGGPSATEVRPQLEFSPLAEDSQFVIGVPDGDLVQYMPFDVAGLVRQRTAGRQVTGGELWMYTFGRREPRAGSQSHIQIPLASRDVSREQFRIIVDVQGGVSVTNIGGNSAFFGVMRKPKEDVDRSAITEKLSLDPEGAHTLGDMALHGGALRRNPTERLNLAALPTTPEPSSDAPNLTPSKVAENVVLPDLTVPLVEAPADPAAGLPPQEVVTSDGAGVEADGVVLPSLEAGDAQAAGHFDSTEPSDLAVVPSGANDVLESSQARLEAEAQQAFEKAFENPGKLLDALRNTDPTVISNEAAIRLRGFVQRWRQLEAMTLLDGATENIIKPVLASVREIVTTTGPEIEGRLAAADEQLATLNHGLVLVSNALQDRSGIGEVSKMMRTKVAPVIKDGLAASGLKREVENYLVNIREEVNWLRLADEDTLTAPRKAWALAERYEAPDADEAQQIVTFWQSYTNDPAVKERFDAADPEGASHTLAHYRRISDELGMIATVRSNKGWDSLDTLANGMRQLDVNLEEIRAKSQGSMISYDSDDFDRSVQLASRLREAINELRRQFILLRLNDVEQSRTDR